MSAKPTRAVIYARISDDREGDAEGVVRQIEDATALLKALGWELNEEVQTTINGVTYKGVLVDNDIGASSKTKKRRPSFDALLELVQIGEVDGIGYYSNSRLTRRPMEFETIIKLVEDTGVKLASCVSGNDDLSTADGRMTARIKASVDAAEAEKIGERVSRQQKQRRDRGLPPPSGRAFGFASGGIEVIQEEADAIRLGAKLILDGASLRDVAREYDRLGIKTVKGAESWSAFSIKRALTRPRVAGVVEHLGKEVGDAKGVEAILDRATWEKVKAAIGDRQHFQRAIYKGREHLLSGLMWCSLCGHRVKVNALRDERGELKPESFVVCDRNNNGCGRVKRNLGKLERYVFAVVERRLEDVRAFDWEEDDTAEDRERARLLVEKEKVEKKIEDLRRLYDEDDDFEAVDFVPMVRKLRNKLAGVEAQLREFEVQTVSSLAPDVLDTWRTGTFEERLDIMQAVVGQIVLHPIGKVGPVRAERMIPETTDITLN